jgi:large repetitive protein
VIGRTFSRALAFVAMLTIALPWSVLAADQVVADGDGLTPVASNALAFGDVCLNTTTSRTILIAIEHRGGGQVFANGASVSFSAAVTGALTATAPSSVTLPSNWNSLTNGAMSASRSSTVSLTAAATSSTGAKSGSVKYTASGAENGGGTLSRDGNLAASWNVVNCDTTPPQLSLPADVTAEATSSAGAVVTYTATASDANPTNPTVTCSKASGSTFALGTTTVNCSATDAAGNTGTGSFTVTVRDTTAPVIANTPTGASAEATSAAGAVVSYTNPTATDTVGPASPAVTCSPASGSTFPLGTTLVTCSAQDTAGNPASTSFNVVVSDTTAPILIVPADITAEATSGSGAEVSFTASATDAVDGNVTPDCDWASGATFPLGTTPVTCSATDAAYNTSDSKSFTVSVVDTTAPEISGMPANITEEATGPGGATASWTAPTASDIVEGSVSVVCDAAPGDTFEIGITTVTCTATDLAGNSDSETFTVTVQDTKAPEIDGNEDQVLEATGPSGAAAAFTVTASDLVDGTVSVDCNYATGDVFPLGDTTISCSATDAANNKATATFIITVRDTTAPEITVPAADITVEAAGPSGAPATYTASATDIVDGDVTPDCAPASGSTFALGTTTVTCSAEDAAGNSDSRSFNVIVEDTTAPAITVPSDITKEATGPNGAAATYSASASDLVDGSITADCVPPSGSTFALGTTSVTCSAEDAAGNSDSKSFNVIVQDTTPPALTVPANITAVGTVRAGGVVS